MNWRGKLNQIAELKQRLSNSGLSKDQITVINLCEVMKVVGGYGQLLELPMTAIDEILNYLEWKSKEQEKQIKK